MAKSTIPKCSHCKQPLNGDDYYAVGKKKYCTDCYFSFAREEVEDWSYLYEYVKEYNGLKELPVSIITMLKRLHKGEFNLSFYGMEQTMRYIYEIEQKESSAENSYCVGLIEYYYDKARIFNDLTNRVAEESEQLTDESVEYHLTTTKVHKDIDYGKCVNKREEIDLSVAWEE